MPQGLVLFRFTKDLRLDDHAGLAAAAARGAVVPLLVIDAETERALRSSPRRAAFFAPPSDRSRPSSPNVGARSLFGGVRRRKFCPRLRPRSRRRARLGAPVMTRVERSAMPGPSRRSKSAGSRRWWFTMRRPCRPKRARRREPAGAAIARSRRISIPGRRLPIASYESSAACCSFAQPAVAQRTAARARRVRFGRARAGRQARPSARRALARSFCTKMRRATHRA